MPSWNDGESSNSDFLGDYTDSDYAPDNIEDDTFRGIAQESTEICRVHKLLPKKCVAFEGTNTGRRFYQCSVPNAVNNCGFVSWVDPEWPETLQNALGRLWAMYEDCKDGRLVETIEHGRLVEELNDEKNKLDKKYTSLIADVNKFVDTTVKKAYQVNKEKIYAEGSREDAQEQKIALLEFMKSKAEEQMGHIEKERNMLRTEVELLKQVQKRDEECQKLQQKQWEQEREAMTVKITDVESVDNDRKKWELEMEAMKEEKKRLEYMLYDLLKSTDGNKEKLKRIRQICDE